MHRIGLRRTGFSPAQDLAHRICASASCIVSPLCDHAALQARTQHTPHSETSAQDLSLHPCGHRVRTGCGSAAAQDVERVCTILCSAQDMGIATSCACSILCHAQEVAIPKSCAYLILCQNHAQDLARAISCVGHRIKPTLEIRCCCSLAGKFASIAFTMFWNKTEIESHAKRIGAPVSRASPWPAATHRGGKQ